MKIRRVDLKNIRSVKKETLRMNEGGFAIVGPNGSGKSTWIYAIEVCLYGSTANLNLSDMIRWGEDRGEIRVWFENSSGAFRVHRTITNRGSQVSVEQYIDGDWQKIGPSADVLGRVLRIPQTVFNEIVIKKQEDFGSFTRATPANRYRIFRDFAGLEIWERYGRKNQELIADLSAKISLLERDKESARQAISTFDLRPLSDEERRSLEEKVANAERMKEHLSSLLSQKRDYEAKVAAHKEAQSVIKKYADAKSWLDRWSKVKDIEEPQVPYSKEDLVKLQSEVKEKESALALVPSEIESADAAYEKCALEIEEAESALPEERKRLEEVRSKNQEVRHRILRLQEERDLVASGRCPTCTRRFNNSEERAAALLSEIEEAKKDLVDTSPIEDSIRDLESRISKLKKEQSDAYAKRRKAEALRKELEDRLGALRGTIEKMEHSKEQAELYKAKRKFFADYPYKGVSPEDAYKKLLLAQSTPEPGEDPFPQSSEEILAAIRKVESEGLSAHSELERAISRAEQYKYHKGIIQRSRDELKEIGPNLETHTKLRELYSRTGVPGRIIGRWVDLVEAEANKQLDRLTDGRFSILFISTTDTGRETIDIAIADNLRGGTRRFFSLSGGERTRVDVALALGLSNAFSLLTGIEIDTMLFDEVYGLDENGQQDFARIIESVAREKPIMGAVSCFRSMSSYFENTVNMKDGSIQMV